MDTETTSETLVAERSLIDRLTPRAGTRVQLHAAAMMWAIGATILIIRGLGYLQGRYWHAWILAVGLALGVFKARFLLDKAARKSVDRIFARGRACFFGFFSWKSWLLVMVMMGGGITLRHLIVHPGVVGAGILGALYIGVGTALAVADRIFWRAVLRPKSWHS